MPTFDPSILSEKGRLIFNQMVPDGRAPDLTISPDGTPYLYRWYIVPRRAIGANVYFHIQVASDPERPLHDHPWDNQSVILEGYYHERIQERPPYDMATTLRRREGQVIHRRAEAAHRLILPEEVPYMMSLFTSGPVVNDWGFWIKDKYLVQSKYSHDRCIVFASDGSSKFVNPLGQENEHDYLA